MKAAFTVMRRELSSNRISFIVTAGGRPPPGGPGRLGICVGEGK